MTDLISQLADQLVALNNASPRLPTKQQIEEVLRGALEHKTMTDGSGRVSDVYTAAPALDPLVQLHMYGHCLTKVYRPSEWRQTSAQEQRDNAAKIEAQHAAVDQYHVAAKGAAELQATAKDFERTAREHTTAAWNRLTPIQRTLCQCPGYSSGEHYWEVDPWSTRETRPDEIAARCVCGATKPLAALPCPGSTDGSHAWSYSVNMDEDQCPCGAHRRA